MNKAMAPFKRSDIAGVIALLVVGGMIVQIVRGYPMPEAFWPLVGMVLGHYFRQASVVAK